MDAFFEETRRSSAPLKRPPEPLRSNPVRTRPEIWTMFAMGHVNDLRKGGTMTVHMQEPSAGMAIHELVQEAHQDDQHERRTTVRFPFFRQVTLKLPGGIRATAFSREISAEGIGMLHDVELPPGVVELTIPSKRGPAIRVRTRILWCHPCGHGWYTSGGQFVGIASPLA
jgi:hypothetical protein